MTCVPRAVTESESKGTDKKASVVFSCSSNGV